MPGCPAAGHDPFRWRLDAARCRRPRSPRTLRAGGVMRQLIIGWVVVIAAVGCGGPEDDAATRQDPLATPSCSVESPRTEEVVNVGDDGNQSVLVAYRVEGVVL